MKCCFKPKQWSVNWFLHFYDPPQNGALIHKSWVLISWNMLWCACHFGMRHAACAQSRIRCATSRIPRHRHSAASAIASTKAVYVALLQESPASVIPQLLPLPQLKPYCIRVHCVTSRIPRFRHATASGIATTKALTFRAMELMKRKISVHLATLLELKLRRPGFIITTFL